MMHSSIIRQNEHGNGLPGNVSQLFHWMISQYILTCF